MKRSQVRALLQKAWLVVKCNTTSKPWCPWSIATRGPTANGWVEWCGIIRHEEFASALLDGLDVRDVTEAGG